MPYQRGRMPDFSIEAQRHSVVAAEDATPFEPATVARGRRLITAKRGTQGRGACARYGTDG